MLMYQLFNEDYTNLFVKICNEMDIENLGSKIFGVLRTEGARAIVKAERENLKGKFIKLKISETQEGIVIREIRNYKERTIIKIVIDEPEPEEPILIFMRDF